MKEINEKLNYLKAKVENVSSDDERKNAEMELMKFIFSETIKLNKRVDEYGKDCLSEEEKNNIITVEASFHMAIRNEGPEVYGKVFGMAISKGYRTLDEKVAIECLNEIKNS